MVIDAMPSPRPAAREGSSEPGNHRRDSTEDADPTLTRKRQRLNEQGDRSRSISLEPAAASATGPSSGANSRSLSDKVHTSLPSSPPVYDAMSFQMDQAKSPTKQGSHEQLSTVKTPSKVTINVRGRRPSTPAEHKHPSPVSEPSTSKGDHHHQAGTNSSHDNRYVEGEKPSSNTASVSSDRATMGACSSSPSIRSPPVEITEVEDIDQEHAGNGWGPRVVDLEPDGAESLMSRFPFFARDCDMRDVVVQLSKALEIGEQPL